MDYKHLAPSEDGVSFRADTLSKKGADFEAAVGKALAPRDTVGEETKPIPLVAPEQDAQRLIEKYKQDIAQAESFTDLLAVLQQIPAEHRTNRVEGAIRQVEILIEHLNNPRTPEASAYFLQQIDRRYDAFTSLFDIRAKVVSLMNKLSAPVPTPPDMTATTTAPAVSMEGAKPDSELPPEEPTSVAAPAEAVRPTPELTLENVTDVDSLISQVQKLASAEGLDRAKADKLKLQLTRLTELKDNLKIPASNPNYWYRQIESRLRDFTSEYSIREQVSKLIGENKPAVILLEALMTSSKDWQEILNILTILRNHPDYAQSLPSIKAVIEQAKERSTALIKNNEVGTIALPQLPERVKAHVISVLNKQIDAEIQAARTQEVREIQPAPSATDPGADFAKKFFEEFGI